MKDDKYADQLHLKSYQFLSCVAPLIWMSQWLSGGIQWRELI